MLTFIYRHKNKVSMIIGVLLSSIALYLAFRNVPFKELAQYITKIDYIWVLPSVAAAVVSLFLRALRWQIIVRSVHRLTFWQAFHPVMIGFMLNCVLPGRVGELARPAVLRSQAPVPFTTGLATVGMERIFDFIILIALLTGTLSTVDIDPEFSMPFGGYVLGRETLDTLFNGMVQLGAVLLVGITLIAFDTTRSILHRGIAGLSRLFFFSSPAFKTRLQNTVCIPATRLIDNLASGFATVKYPRTAGVCLGISVFVWLFQGVSFYVLSWGCPGVTIGFAEMMAVVVLICFFIALPSVPGFWGLWEAGGVFALLLFGTATQAAAGFALVSHAVQMFPVILIGLGSAWISGVNIMQVTRNGQTSPDHQGSRFPPGVQHVPHEEIMHVKARNIDISE